MVATDVSDVLYEQLGALRLAGARVSADQHRLTRLRLQHALVGAVCYPEDVSRLVAARAHVMVPLVVLQQREPPSLEGWWPIRKSAIQYAG